MENKNNGGLVAIIIILLVALLCVCGYVAYDKGLIFNKEVETNEEENKKPENKVEENNTESNYVSLEIKDENCINSSEMPEHYIVIADGVEITTDNSVTIHSYSHSYAFPSDNTQLDFTINFDKKVIDVVVGGLSVEVGTSTVIFLMEDGTLEYMPLYCAGHARDIKSYGKVPGVEDIVKLYNARSTNAETGQGLGYTLLAQKADGTYYDLGQILLAIEDYKC